jgi:hypothetical protein
MSCYYHQDRADVGGCKSCGKALCPECAVDLGKGLACRGRCEEDVRALIQVMDSSIQFWPRTTRLLEYSKRIHSGTGLFLMGAGVVFVAWGLTDIEGLTFPIVLGLGLMAFGGYWFFLARRLVTARQRK